MAQRSEVLFKITDEFAQNVTELRGQEGRDWVERLPDILKRYAEEWHLRIALPFSYQMYNYVTPVETSDGSKAVLKIGFPTDEEFMTECKALQVFNGKGIAKLIQADLPNAVMLIERLEPGGHLINVQDDEERTRIAANVMKKLSKKPPSDNNFPTVRDWFGGFARYRTRVGQKDGPIPKALVDKAERTFEDLIASSGEQVILHGDLHYYNIISAQREPWLAIDPKGVIGEREYETGALIRNPLPELLDEPNPRQVLENRIDRLSRELGFDKKRIRSWGFAQAVLAAIWESEDRNHGWEPFVECAKLLG